MGKRNPKKAVEYIPLEDLSLEDVVSCSGCGGIFDQDVTETCPYCQGNPKEDTAAEVGSPEDQVTCGSCGVVFDKKAKGIDEGGFFSEGGLFCPSCESRVEDKAGKPVKVKRGGDSISWD